MSDSSAAEMTRRIDKRDVLQAARGRVGIARVWSREDLPAIIVPDGRIRLFPVDTTREWLWAQAEKKETEPAEGS